MGMNENVIKDPVIFEYGDLYLKCHNCGKEVKLYPNVKGGLRFDLYTTDQHKLVLKCDDCGNEIELFFKDAEEPPKVEEDEKAQDEEVQNKTEETDEVLEVEEEDNTDTGAADEPQQSVEKDEQISKKNKAKK